MAGPTLYSLGWRQGCLVHSADLRFQVFVRSSDGGFERKERKAKSTDWFVVTSQDCDLDASQDTEPYVELMLCRPAGNPTERESARKNSARRFLVDEERELIALAPFRVYVKASDAGTLVYEPWPGDDFSLERFRQWLGWRYTRPAVPNDVVDAFVRPFCSILEKLAATSEPAMVEFNHSVEEIRFLYFEAEPPYEITLILLVKKDFDPSLVDSITAVLDACEKQIDGSIVSLARPPEIRLESEFPRGLERASSKMNLDYVSYGESEEGQ